MNLKIPVFIVHWNRPWECIKTVQCFLNQDLPLEISIVDNASDSNLFQILRENIPSSVEVIRLEENRGWGGGLNVLLNRWLATKDKPYCFVSAHDALPQKNCLSMLLASMQNDPRIGIACPEYGVAYLPRFSPLRGHHFVSITPRPYGTLESVPFHYGTLTLFRKDCLKEIGVFDERYFAYGDDVEIGLRAWRYHWKVVVIWGAHIVNPGSGTSSSLVSYLTTRNSLFLIKTYEGWMFALLRTIFIMLSTFRLLLDPSSRPSDYVFIARMLAIRDFLLNRYEMPSMFFESDFPKRALTKTIKGR